MLGCHLGESHPIQLHVDHQQLQFLPRGDGRSIEIVNVLSRSQRQTQMVIIIRHDQGGEADQKWPTIETNKQTKTKMRR